MHGCRFGMRGRLWLLWSTMTFGGLFTCLIGIAGDSFGMTIAFVILAAAGIEVWSLNSRFIPYNMLCVTHA